MRSLTMRTHLRTSLLTAMLLTAAPLLRAQAAPSKAAPYPLELAVTCGATYSGAVGGSTFWMQGGSVQVHGRFYGGWGVVADISGAHITNINSTGVGLDLVTATFGPRYTWSFRHGRYSLYGQGLVGQAWGMNSIFPNSAGAMSTADSLAVKAGGGLTVALGRRFALRAVEADYLRTQLPNSTGNVQNNVVIGAGIAFRFR